MNEETKPTVRRAEVVTDSESRIISYVDGSVGALRDDLNKRLDRQDADQRTFNERVVLKLDQVLDKTLEHFNGPGHPVLTTELENLSKRIDEKIEKPWKTWLWVSALVGFIVMLCNLGMGAVMFIINVLPHLHLQ